MSLKQIRSVKDEAATLEKSKLTWIALFYKYVKWKFPSSWMAIRNSEGKAKCLQYREENKFLILVGKR